MGMRIGRIVAVGRGEVTVDLGRAVRLECSDGGCSGCGTAGETVILPWSGTARIGQRVRLRSLEGLHRALAWLAFLAAFAGVLGMAAAAVPAARAEGREQAWAVLAALAAGAVSALAVRRPLRRGPRYRALAVAGEEGRR